MSRLHIFEYSWQVRDSPATRDAAAAAHRRRQRRFCFLRFGPALNGKNLRAKLGAILSEVHMARPKGRRKYGPKAGKKVERAMREMKRGKLRSGRSGKRVKSRKQAIAIGLSEARKSGAKVPRKTSSRRARRRR
jgi:hypothetical protein